MSQAPDLTAVDYTAAERKCDVVMKGGITSGVVYPHAVCELAKTHRFANVGGTSAGAIAAAATAAAERGRESGGFNKLAALPKWLGDGANLSSLFQPQRRTRRLFALLMAGVERGPARALLVALREYRLGAALGAAPGALLITAMLAATVLSGSTAMAVIAAALVLVGLGVVAVGAVLGLLAGIARDATREIPDNGFGICSGAAGVDRGDAMALTPWLAERLDDYAGMTDGEPLTFGHLWTGSKGDEDQLPVDPGDRFVHLAMMTTNLTNRRAHQLPWEARDWFFSPEEFGQLFPPRVVEWMVDHVPPPRPLGSEGGQESRMRRALAREQGLYPLPEPQHIPVVVATRMSLSFPILLSAVPLWRYDMTREDTKDLLGRWREWAKLQEADWDPLEGRMAAWPQDDRPPGSPLVECCWFSDGGISSNFPVHFFDRLVPRWPTFAINLRPFAFGQQPDPDDEAKNTWMVKDNRDGMSEWWYRYSVRPRRAHKDRRLVEFISGMVRTMQNRVDEAQMRAPGYRDRVVHVSMGDDEGGMNLAMDATKLEKLTARGRAAAYRLLDAYMPSPDGAEKRVISWDNHRWVRFRSSLAVMEQMSCRFVEGFDRDPVHPGEERTYEEIFAAQPSYQVEANWQQRLATEELDAFRSVAKHPTQKRSMTKGAPRPAPEGRILPRD